jgi:hypothetical protein
MYAKQTVQKDRKKRFDEVTSGSKKNQLMCFFLHIVVIPIGCLFVWIL